MNLRGAALLFVLATLAAVILGCTGAGATPTATSTATTAASTAVSTPRPTPHPPTPSPSPTPLPGTLQIDVTGAPRGTTTGIASLDAVIDAVAQRDGGALASLMRMQQVACVAESGLGLPPHCPSGVAAGTLVSVFPADACEGGWSRDPRLTAADLIDASPALFAVIRFDTRQRYDVVFTAPFPGQAGYERVMHLAVDGTAVIHYSGGCGPAPDSLRSLTYAAANAPVLILVGPAAPR